jgi:hypothetical protein
MEEMLEKVPWKISGEFSCNGINNVYKENPKKTHKIQIKTRYFLVHNLKPV